MMKREYPTTLKDVVEEDKVWAEFSPVVWTTDTVVVSLFRWWIKKSDEINFEATMYEFCNL